MTSNASQPGKGELINWPLLQLMPVGVRPYKYL